MKNALTIAGSDPSSGAGIQADIRVFQTIGVHPLSVVSSITVQNSLGVKRVVPLDALLVIEQLEAIIEDFEVLWLKTGLLGTARTVAAIAELVEKYSLRAVVDPVLVSTSAHKLTEPETVRAYRDFLFPVSTVVTPNIPEAEAITGLSYRSVGPEGLCSAIKELGPEWVVLKGGHRKDSPAKDILFGKGVIKEFSSEVYRGEFHGTGCVFSSALTAYLALNEDIETAVRKAKGFVSNAIKGAYKPAKGMFYLRIGPS